MENKVYYDDFGNKAIIDECMVYAYRKATQKEKAYRLTLLSTYDNDFIYHLSIHENFNQAYQEMMKTSCRTWKEQKPNAKMYMSKENGYLLTWAEMVKEGKELYDLFDDTNCMTWKDYYEECEM